jgi:hypothetical protein
VRNVKLDTFLEILLLSFLVVVFGALFILISGCSSEKIYMQPVRTYPAAAASKDGYAKSSPDSSAHTVNGIGRVGSVRTGEVVKAYGVNRYVDPADPRVMHERHAIYRMEEGAGWVMQTPQGARGIILGPVVGLKNPEDAPIPRDSEIKRELLASRQALEKSNEELERLRRNQEGMNQYLKMSAEAQGKLAVIAEGLSQRLKRVEKSTGNDKEGDSTERDERTIPK